MADDCLFCKIVAGEIPSKKVYEDEVCYAFDDIEPEAPVHTLVVPKKHYENLNDNPDPELLGHLLSVVPEIAKIKGVYDSGYRVNINTGEDSASTCTSWAASRWAAQPSKNPSVSKRTPNNRYLVVCYL